LGCSLDILDVSPIIHFLNVCRRQKMVENHCDMALNQLQKGQILLRNFYERMLKQWLVNEFLFLCNEALLNTSHYIRKKQ
jgi:hypothetical protein